METNETILTKAVVSIKDRKVVGTLAGVAIDCDAFAVSHYLVSSNATNSTLVLPFANTESVGDTFVIIQDRDCFLPTSDSSANAVINSAFDLAGLKVYSRAGSAIGELASYDIDSTYGTVSEIKLVDGSTFGPEEYVFFAPDFVFVNDGTKTAAELRQEAAEAQAAAEEVAEEAEEPEAEAEPAEEEPVEESSAEEDAEDEQEAEEDLDEPDSDEELKGFLLGKALAEQVVSADGAFAATKGTVLTEELLNAAQKSDALLLLAMSVE